MTHKPHMDRDQADLFGRAPQPVAAKVRPARRTKAGSAQAESPAVEPMDASCKGAAAPPVEPSPAAARPAAASPVATRPAAAPLAELSPADLAALAADVPDEALAVLVIAAVRQLRRRLARGGARHGSKPSPALHRAASQLAAELGGTEDADEF